MTQLFRNDALTGRRALVTGASRGIGAAIASRFASLGAEVVLAADDAPGLEDTKNAIIAAGGSATTEVVDLTDQEAIADLAGRHDDVDTLVNNAAPAQQPFPLLDAPDELWDKMFALNFWAPLRLIKAIVPSMIKAGGGCVINISSISARNPAPRVAPYASSKAALEIVTRVAAMELGPNGIRINSIAPSMVRTQRTQAMLDDPAFAASAVARVPMGRLAETEDVAGAAAWLASDAASFVTGQVLAIEGGSSVGTYSHVPPKAR
ncbi:glucose 1-dehydrogenase [Actinomadura sp. LD22]|uniref:Glucose 1-dehydrogenase n=1 Tax=Actinomadura physcomitrii TaxID=2650748 RepID=A0A6I4MCI1_9ACTN|nr:SDR family oxidoreductase [Actinomadura physcomitrii]MVZ99855.1 glucose 1-dehydrogenase [Actinomadura physcomitrii]